MAAERSPDWGRWPVLYVFGFEKTCVAVSDLYFIDPDPAPGQGEGPERGVRLELRLLEEGPIEGSIYAGRPIRMGRPLWRGDLLESVEGPFGSFDRTHQHLRFKGWEPGGRMYDEALSADPLGYLTEVLSKPERLLAEAELSDGELGEEDLDELRRAAPEIVDAVDRLLKRIYSGELAHAPAGAVDAARAGWL